MVEARLLELIGAEGIAFWRTLGVTVVEAEPGRAVLALAMQPALGTLRAEVMHGGAIATLIDAAAGSAIRTTRVADEPPWRGMATTDLSVSYLDAATSDVTAEGRVLRAGRAIAFVQVDVRRADGTLVAVGRVTATIARRRSAVGTRARGVSSACGWCVCARGASRSVMCVRRQ